MSGPLYDARPATSTKTSMGSTTGSVLCTVDEFVSSRFDFIIVGAGAAGLVLAARLSENPALKVGLLEAGEDKTADPMVNVPNLFPKMLNNKEYDWQLKSVPQQHANNQTYSLPRGRMLGGTTGINMMMYSRGTKSDYDDWAAMVDDKRWSWDSILPYFKKSEDLEATHAATIASSLHGTSGPIHNSSTEVQIPFENPFLEASLEVADFTSRTNDTSNGSHDNFFSCLSTVDRTDRVGTRSYAASGYLLPHLQRPNLKVLTSAHASRVLLSTYAGATVATGVEFTHNGLTYTATASREVILSAGVYKTPQLLELSGIGDPSIIRHAGVQPVVNLPSVGTNLQDHVAVVANLELANIPGNFSIDAFADPAIAQGAMEAYMASGSGPLASPPSAMGFLSYAKLASAAELEETTSSVKNATWLQRTEPARHVARLRDERAGALQMVLVPANLNATREGMADQSKFIQPAPTGGNRVSIVMATQYPLSRGTVHIASSDHEVQPLIDPAYLAHPADVAVLRAGLAFVDKVAQKPAVQALLVPGLSVAETIGLGDREREEAYVRAHAGTEYHPVGTAAMGSVVDSSLKVKGVQGLRVVDASVFPSQISGNVMATVYAIAEKAAEMILTEV